MSDTRTYIVPDGQENSTNQMLPWMAMMNGGMGGFGGNGIKCKLPETVTLPYSCATAVPTQAVFNGYALGTYAGWNGCGCNNSLWG